MKIPKKIKIIGRNIEVVYDKDMYAEDQRLGLCEFSKGRISLCEKGGKSVPRKVIEVTLLHEWVHMIFMMLGKKELAEDETLADQLAEMIHQLIPQVQD